MPYWKESLVALDATIRDAITTINEGGFEICLMVEEDGALLGTITDGDIRRGLLEGMDMDKPARNIVNREPVTAPPGMDNKKLLDLMNAELFRQIPLLDDENKVVGLAHYRHLTPQIEPRDNWVVLMAGGLGERLKPITDLTPKPLLTVGDRPLLQTILESFVEQGFHKFYISVNYRADAIKNHFGDGSNWNAEIRYLEENQRLGTAGAIGLIPEKPERPFVVMNGDLITRISFQDLLDYHNQHKSKATMCVREYDFQVPFGVVGIDGNRVTSIDEKPVHRFFVNAGIYVLDPDLIEIIPGDVNYDMTELFETVISSGQDTTVFPIHEYWLDIGRSDDLIKANTEFSEKIKS